MIDLDTIHARLQRPHSHLSQTTTMAANEDGDLVLSICLFGGCLAPLTPSTTTLDDGTTETQYLCTELSDSNLVLAPGREGDTLEVQRPMPRPRYRHSSVAINGQIWIVGGRDRNNNIINEIDVYDELHDRWFTIEDGLNSILLPDEAPYGVSDHCAFAYGQNLFIVGGFDQNYNSVGYTVAIITTDTVEQKKFIYSIRSSMNVARGACGVTTIGDYAMVAGGFSNDDGYCEAMQSVEIYDPKSNSWNVLTSPMRFGRARPNLVYLDHQVYAFGGERRGVFDSGTGHCDGSGGDSNGMATTNKLLPNRLSYPVNSVEVLRVEDDIYTSQWKVLQVSECSCSSGHSFEYTNSRCFKPPLLILTSITERYT